ncbi:MAG TPA: ribonuclease HII [Gemmatimonadaceae bacterium]|nr:ribonuclease HII [Gemmatimonadaceae bacterium]
MAKLDRSPARRPGRRWSSIERDLRAAGSPLIAGVDEVGRGPLAGPVVACAVVMPPDARAIAGVDDSKKLTCAARVRLAARIRERALAVGVGAASVREIERLNIFHATVLAMRRALSRLAVTPDHVIVDGKRLRTLGVEHTAVVGGDARCYNIACASIVAKVTRDRLMERLATRYPDYRWDRNAGYGTPDHLAGLAARGITPHHRRSFCAVSQLSLQFGGDVAVAPLEEITLLVADADLPSDAVDDEVSADDIGDDTPPSAFVATPIPTPESNADEPR